MSDNALRDPIEIITNQTSTTMTEEQATKQPALAKHSLLRFPASMLRQCSKDWRPLNCIDPTGETSPDMKTLC
jgi:hypothetical protein